MRSSPRESSAPGSRRRARTTRKICTGRPIKNCRQTEQAPAIAIQRQGKSESKSSSLNEAYKALATRQGPSALKDSNWDESLPGKAPGCVGSSISSFRMNSRCPSTIALRQVQQLDVQKRSVLFKMVRLHAHDIPARLSDCGKCDRSLSDRGTRVHRHHT